MSSPSDSLFTIRQVTVSDIGEVYRLLVANRPYVGLNSRYTYLLLAMDFSNTCIVAEANNCIVGFCSGYIPPMRSDTFFCWEIVVDKEHRGNGLQKKMLLYQIEKLGVTFFEATVNPSNEISKQNFTQLANQLNAYLTTSVLFGEDDFENDGHEAEILYRIGPILVFPKTFGRSINL